MKRKTPPSSWPPRWATLSGNMDTLTRIDEAGLEKPPVRPTAAVAIDDSRALAIVKRAVARHQRAVDGNQ